jgi:hypothetical protein
LRQPYLLADARAAEVDEAFLMQPFADKEFAHQEQISHVDYIAQRRNQRFRFVTVQALKRIRFFFRTMLAQRRFGQLLAVARIRVR